MSRLRARDGQVDPLISWLRLPGRYLLAFWLIPVGVLIGVCAVVHAGFRRLPGVRRPS